MSAPGPSYVPGHAVAVVAPQRLLVLDPPPPGLDVTALGEAPTGGLLEALAGLSSFALADWSGPQPVVAARTWSVVEAAGGFELRGPRPAAGPWWPVTAGVVLASAVRAARPAAHPPRLRLSTGEEVDVDGPVVLGRRPRALAGVEACLVTVPSPRGYVSGSHLEFSTEEGHLLVQDVSTNGTLLHRPGHPLPQRLPARQPQVLVTGCRLELGDGVWVEVVRAQA